MWAEKFVAPNGPISINTDMSNILLAFISEASPCHLKTDKNGKTID